MKDKDRIQLIKLLLDDMDEGDHLESMLAAYYRKQVGPSHGARLAHFLEQYEHCEGPFSRDGRTYDVMPGHWVQES